MGRRGSEAWLSLASKVILAAEMQRWWGGWRRKQSCGGVPYRRYNIYRAQGRGVSSRPVKRWLWFRCSLLCSRAGSTINPGDDLQRFTSHVYPLWRALEFDFFALATPTSRSGLVVVCAELWRPRVWLECLLYLRRFVLCLCVFPQLPSTARNGWPMKRHENMWVFAFCSTLCYPTPRRSGFFSVFQCDWAFPVYILCPTFYCLWLLVCVFPSLSSLSVRADLCQLLGWQRFA